MTSAKKTAARKPSAKKKPSTRATTGSAKRSAKKTPKKPVRRKAPVRKATAKSRASTKPSRSTSKKPTQKKPSRKKPTTKEPTQAKKTTRARRPSRGQAQLEPQALASVKKQLLSEREDLKRQETELEEESFEGNQAEMMGEIGLDDDFADAGTATFDRERDLSIRNNILDLVEQIDHALRRIDEGTYGSCERCGKPIERARLKALPHAVLCLDCKRREERAR